MNDQPAVMEAPLETDVEQLEQIPIVEQESVPVAASAAPVAEQPEVMELPENVNPRLLDSLILVEPDDGDIAEEIEQLDTFQEYQREIFSEMRGFTSDQF